MKIDGSLRVKGCTMIFTHQWRNFDCEKENEQEEATSSNHIIIQKYENSDSKIELVKTPKTLQDRGQAIVNNREKLNLTTAKEPCSIYVSSLLTLKEEKEYFDLVFEYKDVFAYKEMPALHPKVIIHHLSIKKAVHPWNNLSNISPKISTWNQKRGTNS